MLQFNSQGAGESPAFMSLVTNQGNSSSTLDNPFGTYSRIICSEGMDRIDRWYFIAVAVCCLILGVLEVAYYYHEPKGPPVIYLKR